MIFKLGATIPVVQYGNLQPVIEIDTETWEEAKAFALPKIEELWRQYGEKPLPAKGNRTLLKAFVGGEIYFDEVHHEYTNEAGEVYLSGSGYAAKFEKPFDAQGVADKMALKSGVPTSEILAMWELKRDISNGFGTAIHAALELYGKYNGHAEALNKTYHIHDHPVIKNAVESFYKAHKGTYIHEALVVDHTNKRAGRIDILEKTDKGYIVGDFKTNAEIEGKLDNYWHQLSFYAHILKANDLPVVGLKIFHWNGEWAEYKSKVLDLREL